MAMLNSQMVLYIMIQSINSVPGPFLKNLTASLKQIRPASDKVSSSAASGLAPFMIPYNQLV